MKPTLSSGVSRTERITVDRPRTIDFLGEQARLYSTPSMVGDVEYACWRLLEVHLENDESSVGIHVSVDHLGATPLGETVEVTVRVSSVEGRKVVFEAEVIDAVELVGRGTHTRYVIDVPRHRKRLEAKLAELSKKGR